MQSATNTANAAVQSFMISSPYPCAVGTAQWLRVAVRLLRRRNMPLTAPDAGLGGGPSRSPLPASPFSTHRATFRWWRRNIFAREPFNPRASATGPDRVEGAVFLMCHGLLANP
jgi:hypothetical protein